MNVERTDFYLKSHLVKTAFDIDDKHIKAVESLVRNSLEYKTLIGEKRQYEHENRCALLKDFDFSDKKTNLDLHHVIFLYSICKAAYKCLLETNKEAYVSTFEAANKVMEWHNEGAFLYIFLSRSAHQLYHTGSYKFEMKDVKGNREAIHRTYYKYLTEEEKALVDGE